MQDLDVHPFKYFLLGISLLAVRDKRVGVHRHLAFQRRNFIAEASADFKDLLQVLFFILSYFTAFHTF